MQVDRLAVRKVLSTPGRSTFDESCPDQQRPRTRSSWRMKVITAIAAKKAPELGTTPPVGAEVPSPSTAPPPRDCAGS